MSSLGFELEYNVYSENNPKIFELKTLTSKKEKDLNMILYKKLRINLAYTKYLYIILDKVLQKIYLK